MTGIFKINNNEVIGSDGTFSGTIGSNATLPTKVTDKTYLYQAFRVGTSMVNFGIYNTTNDLASGGKCTINGCVPAGVTSIVEAVYIYIMNDSATGNAVSLEWYIGGSNEDYNEDSLSSIEFASGINHTANKLKYLSFLNVSSSPNRFEDKISANDMFALAFQHLGGGDVRAIGAKITWRF